MIPVWESSHHTKKTRFLFVFSPHSSPTLFRSLAAPKKLHWKIEVDGRGFENEEAIFDLVKNVARGKVLYNKTNFGDTGRTYVASSRKKHFSDGYWVYSFWFSRKTDAALFKLMATTV